MSFSEDYPFVFDVALRWGDMDAFGHVNNTHYFRYFEDARIAFMEACEITTTGLPTGVGPILASTGCRYRAPLVYPDRISVGARVSEIGEDRFAMEYAIWSETLERIAATGEAVVVSFDYTHGKKAPLPQSWIDAMNAMQEAGNETDG